MLPRGVAQRQERDGRERRHERGEEHEERGGDEEVRGRHHDHREGGDQSVGRAALAHAGREAEAGGGHGDHRDREGRDRQRVGQALGEDRRDLAAGDERAAEVAVQRAGGPGQVPLRHRAVEAQVRPQGGALRGRRAGARERAGGIPRERGRAQEHDDRESQQGQQRCGAPAGDPDRERWPGPHPAEARVTVARDRSGNCSSRTPLTPSDCALIDGTNTGAIV